jgi:GAF domain-containing protein
MVPSPPAPARQPAAAPDRVVPGPATESARLQQGVELAVQLLDSCDHAGVTVATGSALVCAAATVEIVRQGDAWQHELREGPCVDVVRLQHTVLSQDLGLDRRWLIWAPRVVDQLGVHSMLSLLLFTAKDTYAALNLYARRPYAWDDDQLAVALTLAEHLAVDAAEGREVENRGRAMVTRAMIGQAEGILMERFGLTADRAFEYLRRVSQTNHVKLADVAAEIVETRALPAVRTPAQGA